MTIDDPRAPLLRRLTELTMLAALFVLLAAVVPGAVAPIHQPLAVAVLLASSILRLLLPRWGPEPVGAGWLGVVAVIVGYQVWMVAFGPFQVVLLAVMVIAGQSLHRRPGIVLSVGVACFATVLAALAGRWPELVLMEWLLVLVGFVALGALSWWQLGAHDEAQEAALQGADELVAQQSKYAELVRNAPDGVLALGVDARLRSVSPAVARMTGFRDEELLGRCLWELPWWDEASRSTLESAFDQILAGQPLACEALPARERAGDPAWYEVRASLVRSSDGAMGVHATLRDVSDRERAERARVAYEQRLQQAQRVELMGRLAGSVAHDFNNLLAVISTNAELLSLEAAVGNDQLEDLRAAAELGGRLTRKLMALTKAQQVEIGAVNVQRVLQGLRPVLRSALPESIELSIHVAPKTAAVAAGPTHLEQLIVNLVVNARDAMPDGGTLDIWVAPSSSPVDDAHPAEEWVRVVVQDTGVGIDPEHRDLVFEPFFSTKGTHGTGLGLASVLGIVQQLDGHVDLESTVGEGSTFTVYLRGTDAEQVTEVTEVTESTGAQASQVRGGTVLLVEDGDPVRRATRRSLNHLGYEVIEVESVRGALAELERGMPDIILSDVVMPKVTGVDLMREVRTRWPQLPVVLMSAHATVPGAADADAFVSKPFSLEVVAGALERGRVAAQHRVEG